MGDENNAGKNRVYDDELLNSKNINICQFECDPHLEATIRARNDPKHVDKCARIVQETTSKISQTVRCWLHVYRWGWVGPITRVSYGRVDCGKVGAIDIVILLDALHKMVWLDRCVENKCPTHRNKWVCLCWDRFDDPVILMHLHMWN